MLHFSFRAKPLRIELVLLRANPNITKTRNRLAGTKVLQLFQLANFDLSILVLPLWIRETPGPLYSLFPGLHLYDGVAGNQLLGLGERPVDQSTFLPGVFDAPAHRTRLKPGRIEQRTGFRKFFVVL